ncbi:MAG TPA: PAS domain S-box protein [Gemmatimonadales bacterium]|nr:PAS domain S-box protein [Gemmatimonadales bacterium]
MPRFRPSRSLTPYAVLVVVLLVSAVFARYVVIAGRTRDQLRFRSAADEVRRSIEARLEIYLALLHAGNALFAASADVTWSDFHNFAQHLQIREHYPGLLGIGYAARIDRASIDSLVGTMRQQWDPQFHLWPDSARSRYTSIVYLEPLDARNRHAMGYDMGTDSVRAAAMAAARDLGQPVLSGKVELVQEVFPEKQAGFLIYEPVYRRGAPTATVAARRAALAGWVYSPLRAGDFLDPIQAAESSRKVGLMVYDGSTTSPQALLYATAGVGSAPPAHLSLVRTINVANHPWTLVFFVPPGMAPASGDATVPLILGLGVLVGGALFFLSRAQLRAQLAAERSAADLRSSRRALEQSEQQFRQLVEQSPLSIQVLDPAGRTIQVNRAYEELWGVGLDELQRLGYSVLEDPQLEAAGVMPHIRRAFEGIPSVVPPVAYRPPVGPRTGEELWISSHVYPVRDPDGHTTEVVLIHENISERRRAERRLQYQLDLMNTITANAVDALFLMDRDGRVTYVNPAAERIFGWRRDEILGRVLHDLVHSDRPDGTSYPRAECPLVQVLRSGRSLQNHEDFFLHRDGHLVPVSCSNSPIFREGEITSAVLVVHDITERRRAEAALRESEERLRAIFSQVNVGIAQTALDGRFLMVNERYCEMLGYTRAQLLEFTMEDVTHPDDRAQSREVFAEVIRSGIGASLEKRYLRRDGEVVWVAKSVSVVRDSSGQPSSAVLIAEDITDRKRAEEALRHTQKLESIGLLAGGIAHDFNNLLTGILGNASLALRSLTPDNRSDAASLLEDVIRASDRAADLTRQLLAYAGKGRFYLQPVRLDRLVREITGLIRTSIPRKVELTFALAPDLPMVEADPGQLQQLVMNLVINGAEAIGDEPGTVKIVAESVVLTAAEAARDFPAYPLVPGHYVRLIVEDSGCGMSAATQAQIFDPFFTTKFTGRGLGLAAALGIVRGHHGAITVTSTPGQGSRFTVVLPAATASVPEPRAAAPVPASNHAAAGQLVVVAEDEPVLRGLARAVLEEAGFTVLVAEHGGEALELVAEQRGHVSAVVLDLTMPVLSGAEAAERLAADFPDLPVIITSGYGETEARGHFGELSPRRFLQKPYTPEGLVAAVREALG